jgi:hypothetical protein
MLYGGERQRKGMSMCLELKDAKAEEGNEK